MGKGTGRKKKQFINKKNAITFDLVHRAQRDPLTYDESAPKMVLKPTGTGKDVSESSVGGWNFPQFIQTDSVSSRQRGRHYSSEDDFYDYGKHMLPMGSGQSVFVGADGTVSDNIPDLIFGSIKQEDVGYMTNVELEEVNSEDLDPELREAMENAEEGGDLWDNFVEIANLSDSAALNDPSLVLREESEDDGMYGEEFDEFSLDDELDQLDLDFAVHFDFSIDDDYEEYVPYSAPKGPVKVSKEREFLTLQMERALEEGSFDYSDSEELPPQEMSMLVHQVLDDFLEYGVPQPYQANAHSLKNMTEEDLERYFEDSSSVEIVRMEVKKRNPWDCESILSTYTNTENHPRLIDTPKLDTKKIVVNKYGFPRQLADYERRMQEQEEDEEAINKGEKRSRNETPEEKAERKRRVKEERRMKRMMKKDMKEAFKEESVKQRSIQSQTLTNRTLIKY
eukprot:TRINITY_DN8690_c0_g1_i1.p1 TRINITY_DN8690_c0_g1~~TRINITY_DN8690_c0_g1_i1.p1  ORF type:complete len:467 (+),score=146.82 TRINITY_DN8690_c0_g1_i1:47-1402(+)